MWKSSSGGRIFLFLVLVLMLVPPRLWAAAPLVQLARVPGHGLQPQVALDAAGGVHLVYFTGEAAGGNIDYVVSHDGGRTYSPPLQVNSIANSAVAVGNMRGAHLALGPGGAVYVAWVGSYENGHAPMWFARLLPGSKAFESQRNLAPGMPLDGGAIASAGNVVEVYWHGLAAGKKSEAERQVWVARSGNGGRSFAPAAPLWSNPTGVCGCCGMAAAGGPEGKFFVIYRAATAMVHRDLYLLHSDDGGRHFRGAELSPWEVGYCVMSTAQLSRSPIGLVAAWEQRGQVRWGRVGKDGAVRGEWAAPGPARDRKYPAIAVNRRGEALLAWTEGMGWKRGGSLHWQLYAANGQPLSSAGSEPGVPAWSLVAAFAHPDGSFTILY